jgi:hypothetical protein
MGYAFFDGVNFMFLGSDNNNNNNKRGYIVCVCVRYQMCKEFEIKPRT